MTQAASFPTSADILDYINAHGSSSKNELARAFQLKSDDRARLKSMLRDMEREGALVKDGKRLATDTSLPPVLVLKAETIDAEGEVWARPAESRSSGLPWPKALTIRVRPSREKRKTLAKGDKFLARTSLIESQDAGPHCGQNSGMHYEAAVIKVLPKSDARPIVGVYSRGRVEPTDRRDRNNFYKLEAENLDQLKEGELLVVLPEKAPGRFGPPLASLIERLGKEGSVASISTIAIVERQIPTDFGEEALAQAEASGAPTLKGRTDLRDVPLVTVDGIDARDFDDAIYAEPVTLDNGAPGFKLMIAIADVSAYVGHNSPLDLEAKNRGNSCYFPDQVIPMLPETLSNGWCSLVPNEERGCLAVQIWIDEEGNRVHHRFVRGLMRSHARLTYEQVEDVLDGEEQDQELPDPILKAITNLLAAYEALDKARINRGTLDLDVPERKAVLSDDRQTIIDIRIRERLTSHKIIEEFMILANVCAAETLETHERATAYRVHDAPDPARVDSLRDMLKGLDIELAKGMALAPKDFNRVLVQVDELAHKDTVHEAILRSQSRALYTTDNIGHFGLSLEKYAHFTSPIRRYADLTIHRALIDALNLGNDGKSLSHSELEGICEGISHTERRAVDAERASMDRYLASYHSHQVGQTMEGKVTTVVKHGIFVKLQQSGAEGLLPFSYLPDDRYEIDPISQVAIGRDTKIKVGVGDKLELRLVEAKPLQGGLLFEYLDTIEQGVAAHQLRYGFKQLRERSNKLDKKINHKDRNRPTATKKRKFR